LAGYPNELRATVESEEGGSGDRLCLLLRDTCRAVNCRMANDLNIVDAGSSEWFALSLLGRLEDARISDVCQGVGLDSGATTRLVDKLESKLLVRRERSIADRRVVNLVLTFEGRAALDAMAPQLRRFRAALVDCLRPDEEQQLTELLTRLRDGLGR
jgi:DNA-binding MarR family transcriptional regulator